MAKKSSPWMYVGVGCAVIVLLGIVGVVGVGLWLRQVGQEISEEMQDPVKRADKAKNLLGIESLPEGYHTGPSIPIPFLGDFILLSDTEWDPETEYANRPSRVFMFMNFRSLGNDKELDELFAGESSSSDFWARFDFGGIKLTPGESKPFKHGNMAGNGYDIDFALMRSPVGLDGRNQTSLLSLLRVRCSPDDGRLRLAIWMMDDPAPDMPPEQADFSGTPGDETAIQGFMRPMQPCPQQQ